MLINKAQHNDQFAFSKLEHTFCVVTLLFICCFDADQAQHRPTQVTDRLAFSKSAMHVPSTSGQVHRQEGHLHPDLPTIVAIIMKVTCIQTFQQSLLAMSTGINCIDCMM
jgi:hypothetical protein